MLDVIILARQIGNFMLPPTERDDDLLDLNEDESSIEELESQVQKAKEQLLSLRHQQDLIERQKQELEELSRRQNDFEKGRSELCESFQKALVALDRESYEAQKRTEQIRMLRDAFARHLDRLESINPKHWAKNDLAREINQSLAAVEEARNEYIKGKSLLNACAPKEVIEDETHEGYEESDGGHDFVYWLKSGFAFTLPLQLLGLAYLVLLLLRFVSMP